MTSSPRRPRRVPSLLWTFLLVSAAAGESPRVARPGRFPAADGERARRGRGLRSPFAARPLIAPDLRACPGPPGELTFHVFVEFQIPTPRIPHPHSPHRGGGEERHLGCGILTFLAVR
ncbi:unnamed protein product [Rangifer tarandus platyrhynchus]|uniref:Uncharacterized protein n=2 Tax=Rangifer tarandus platyrhynchus TaxID=3082113 RepID=A0ACB1KGW7_RANTA|nr:unnamed protein product [Rangifer tarandus platyrhynchus]